MRWPRRRSRRDLDVAVTDCAFLAVDLETTGMDPGADHVVAVGWVPVQQDRVVLAGARSRLVRPPVGTGRSTTIHRLTDEALADAPPWEEVLPDLLGALEGRVLVCHYAPMEVGFLRQAAPALDTRFVDTLALEQRLRGEHAPPGAFRLDAARRRHGLPTYAAHDVLTDALAAAELLLAQAAELGERLGRVPTLRDLGARWTR